MNIAIIPNSPTVPEPIPPKLYVVAFERTLYSNAQGVISDTIEIRLVAADSAEGATDAVEQMCANDVLYGHIAPAEWMTTGLMTAKELQLI